MKGKGQPLFASKPRATQLESPGLKQTQKVGSLSFHLSPTFNPSRCAKSPQHWRELPFPPPRDLPDPGIEPALAGGFFTTSTTWKVLQSFYPTPNICCHDIYLFIYSWRPIGQASDGSALFETKAFIIVSHHTTHQVYTCHGLPQWLA